MKIHAYVLAADPAWIEASVKSYYDLVDRIVVSYDPSGRGWTGKPVAVQECLARLKTIDPEGKMAFHPGNYARTDFSPMENDTHQRSCALQEASQGADWVVQLDTDEVLADSERFAACLKDADAKGCAALNFPSINLYANVKERWYLECCLRGWRRAAGYPAPMAVKAGSTLTFSRRVPGNHYHVDLGPVASPWAVPPRPPVDRIIGPNEALYHFTFVRSDSSLQRKFASWSHANDCDWSVEFQRWRQARKRPWLASLRSQFERGPKKRPLRLTRIPPSVAAHLAACEESEF